MPERVLTYRFETEDASSGPLTLIENQASSLEAGFRRLMDIETQLNQRREASTQLALANAAAQEELADAGIQTTASLEAQIQKYDRLLDFVQADNLATLQLTQRKKALQAQLAASTATQGRFAGATGQSAAFVNNLSFSLNDSQQFAFGFDQGLRAISNNLGVMIGQFQGVIAEAGGFRGAMKSLRTSLVGGLGISVAFSAVSTAAVLLQGAFRDTQKAGGETAETLQDQFAPLIRILDATKGSFNVTFGDLEEDQREVQAAIEATTTRLEELNRTARLIGTSVGGSVEERLGRLEGVNAQIEEQNALLKEQQDNLSFVNAQLLDEQRIRELIAQGEALGFTFEIDKTEEQKRQEQALEDQAKQLRTIQGLQADIADLNQFESARLSEIVGDRRRLLELIRAGNTAELANVDNLEAELKAIQDIIAEAGDLELTAVQELVIQRRELVELLGEQNLGEFETLTLLEREIEKLEEVAEVRRNIIRDQADQAEILERFGDIAIPVQLEAGEIERIDLTDEQLEDLSPNIQQLINRLNVDLTDLSDGAENVNRFTAALDGLKLAPIGLSDGVIDEVEAISETINDRLFMDIERFIELNESLSESIRGSLAGGIASFGDALGDIASGAASFSALGQSLLLTLADLAGNVGQQLIAFGVAGLALRRLVANPLAAIAAGTALIALGRVARNRVQSTIDAAGSGGGIAGGGFSSGPAAPTFATPRNTEEERLEREERARRLAEQREIVENRARREAEERFTNFAGSPFVMNGPGGLTSSPLFTGIPGGVGSPFSSAPQSQRLTIGVRSEDPVVLPGGSLLLAIREALEQEVELGGSGELGA